MLRFALRKPLANACRRYLSDDVTSSAEKAARLARRKVMEQSQHKSGTGGRRVPYGAIGVGVITMIAAYAVYDISREEEQSGICAQLYKSSGAQAFINRLFDPLGDFFLPSKDKLMPDWPTDPVYANVAPGTPAPPLLVVDVEKTLIGSEHDAKHGWRFVKRPGADKFLDALANGYYEIALFSERDIGMVEPILMALDPPPHKCHHLYSTHAEYTKKNKMLKRLDLMNRDIRKIILIDDDPEAFEGFERNTIQVQPFEDLRDRRDSVLLDLIPLLQSLVHHDSSDFRVSLDDLGTHNAEEVVVEYQMRVAKAKEDEKKRRNSGLGGLIRGVISSDVIEEDPMIRSKIPSPSSLVGGSVGSHTTTSSSGDTSTGTGNYFKDKNKKADGGIAVKKKGKLFEWLDQAEREKEEQDRLKFEKMNQIHAKKMLDKQIEQRKKETETFQHENA